MQKGAVYSIVFAAVVCLVCAVFVSASAVSLKSRQDENAFLDKQRNVLIAAGLAREGEVLSTEEVQARFGPIQSVVVDLETGQELPEMDPETFDQRAASSDPDTSRDAPNNPAGIQRLPNQALVYRLEENDALDLVILPIEGKGLWSTLYGFIALDADLETIRGITFYEHKETAGLGGEVDNPRWKALWPGRRAFDEGGEPTIEVIRGQAGPHREERLEPGRGSLHVHRREHRLQGVPVRLGGAPLQLEAFARQGVQILAFEFVVDAPHVLPELLEHPVQAIAPLSQAVVRLRKHPRDAAYRREIDFACVTARLAVAASQWRLVATRTGEQVA